MSVLRDDASIQEELKADDPQLLLAIMLLRVRLMMMLMTGDNDFMG